MVLAVMNWDLYLMNLVVPDEQEVLWWRNALKRRIDDVLRCKNQHTVLVLQTTPHTRWGGKTGLRLNSVMREVSEEQSVRLMDWDRRIWTSTTVQKDIFRDSMHPTPKASAQFAEALLASES